jgi:hypothetical protein
MTSKKQQAEADSPSDRLSRVRQRVAETRAQLEACQQRSAQG